MNNTTKISSEDREFMTKAAHAGVAEVKAVQMALEKSKNDDVQQFARRMIDDHSKANDELKQLAAEKNETLPTEPSEEQQETANELSELSGEEFDAEYMDAQVSDHETVIDFFQDEIDEGSDSDKNKIDKQVEVISLVGDVALKDDKPKIHAHVVAKRDATARDGHLIEGKARPTLDVILTESPAKMRRKYNEKFVLALIDLDA